MNSLPFKLKTDTATIYDIPEECINNFRAIVIADHHFALCRDIKNSLPIFKSKLELVYLCLEYC